VTPALACSAPSGYVANTADCNDASASIKPGATETCNGVDDDCDGSTDEGVRSTYYRDVDGDLYGTPSLTVQACSAPSGYRAVAGDCNDSSALVHPGRAETCNSVDDDCDGSTDEGVRSTYYRDADNDGFGTSGTTVTGCSAPSGYRSTSGDCNDGAASIKPGATETCNGVDDDCDGTIDDNAGTLYYRDADTDGYGNPGVSIRSCSSTTPSGYRSNANDCDDTRATVRPGGREQTSSECDDGWDNDCDGLIDADESVCCNYLPYC
jgi:hypothetical protein